MILHKNHKNRMVLLRWMDGWINHKSIHPIDETSKLGFEALRCRHD
jgi:hypothetical protein